MLKKDYYGRLVPEPAGGSVNLGRYTASTRMITEAAVRLFDEISDPMLTVRRVSVTANHTTYEDQIPDEDEYEQLDLFTDYEARDQAEEAIEKELDREKALMKATLELKKRFGKNAVIKGTDLQEGAMTIARNDQIGGHKA